MVIASIDLQDGKVVQLRQGAELVLQRDNGPELAEEFDRYGEVAVIDLDAAMGKGSNRELVKPLLRKAECRLGGGIKKVEQAREWVSLGAKKIILGSAAFRKAGKEGNGPGIDGGEFGLQLPFLEELAREIGRERVILAVDARLSSPGSPPGGYEIVVDGWKTPTGLDLIKTAQAAEPYVGEFLFTNVDREGTMTGIDLAPVRALREAVSAGVTVAGGVASLEEIEALAALGCDVQLGMALYTGKVNLADAFVRSLNWKKASPAIPVIAQSPDGQVLMTGFADHEAVTETFRRGKLCFHSRSRDKLWMKGESSGNTLTLLRLRADCDRDALLATVESAGPVCHTGAWSCFTTDRRYTGEFLQNIIAERLRTPRPGSYTATLDDDLVREKVREEAEELCTACNREEIIWEAADLLYFATVLLTRAGVTVKEVLDELDRRHKK
ncbi:MAG: phosphoribosyl-ATP diphosphatase [Spirochaetaceae bacterium]|jgi:phosphoribosyl-ATP pyrophosphohydrolase/phosphoribosyl-AMP cyclohydrolase|nr:phosphoribosyl-ATP diphosphatase [Spirochaetaceae bacterium]